MRASLPMYLRPETAQATQVFWQNIQISLADHGIKAPSLSPKPNLPDHWLQPDLLLSQTCGRPYALKLHTKVQLVGTPDFGLEGCPAGYYRSAIIVRANDQRANFSGATLAFNDPMSQSGYAAARGLDWTFGTELETGSHLNSIAALFDGSAEIATTDTVTWALAERYDDVSALRVLGWTRPTPGLPYITALNNDPQILFAAVKQALQTTPEQIRKTLMIRDIVQISDDAYQQMIKEGPQACA